MYSTYHLTSACCCRVPVPTGKHSPSQAHQASSLRVAGTLQQHKSSFKQGTVTVIPEAQKSGARQLQQQLTGAAICKVQLRTLQQRPGTALQGGGPGRLPV